MARLIAIVGLAGSGKTTAGQVLLARNFTRVYFGGITLEKLKEAGEEINEANERKMREQLRRDYGMAAYATLSLPKIEAALAKGDVFIDGLYSWEEYLVLKEKFPQLEMIAIYTPPAVRYQRLTARPVRPLTAAEAESRDHAQIENLHQAGPIVMANSTLINLGSEADLATMVENYLDGKN